MAPPKLSVLVHTLCNNLCADSLQRAEGKRTGNGGVASWVICWADGWGEWGPLPPASITFFPVRLSLSLFPFALNISSLLNTYIKPSRLNG